MVQYSFGNKNCVYFGIKLDAKILIWMQSRFEGFDFSASLFASAVTGGNIQLLAPAKWGR